MNFRNLISAAALGSLFLGSSFNVYAGAKPVTLTEPELQEAESLFKAQCSSCHGTQRLGGMGPALLPDNLSRLRKTQASDVIANGRAATQMPAFGSILNKDQQSLLANYIYTQPKLSPQWSDENIKASQIINHQPSDLPAKPKFEADLMNLFLVVELGDHHVTLLNGDTFEPIHRFKSRFALHGGPKYSPDGRFVYFASRDGWITKYDIYNLTVVAEVRAGVNTRNLAVSSDGKSVMVANYLPNNLVLLDSETLDLIKVYPVENAEGKSSRVSAVYNAPPRNTFIAALKDLKEVWEIPYPSSDKSKSKEERAPKVRPIAVNDYLDDFFFDPDYKLLIGASRDSAGGQVVDLDLGKVTSSIPLPGMPHLGSGITWDYQGKQVLATPNLKEGKVSVIDMKTWKVIKDIKTEGPGFFMRSHEQSPYAWVDVFFGPNKEAVHVIDKNTLEIVKTLRPAPGKTAAHVEFNKDGSKLLLSIWDMDGEVIVYDANTLEEEKRLPMVKPSGKYNVWNKTQYERGTSH
ncbi:nitrite reductase [Litoribrevibacter albus]|uniref:Cytochrome c n=1 Tax=Litoribrevibacter albus TaxID=1473156 RepID=A0AA37S826_9GAMM|nr:nitrite reductase [Litoribrevibacter albus]GLQ30892.1 cytochrome c [Litoribrevibacter albus]